MEKFVNIRDFYFGKSTAEQEADALHNYFVSTGPYRNAKDRSRKKLLYIGNRGSGKSALFRHLSYELRLKKNIISDLIPNDFSYDAFRKMKHEFTDIRSAYNNAWYYTLLIDIFKSVVLFFDEHKNIKKNRHNLEIIDDFLVRNNFKRFDEKIKVLVFFLRRLSSLKIQMINNKKPENSILELFAREDIRLPLNALSYISQSYPVHVFIDELDTGWDNTPESQNFINGLLYAADKIDKIRNINVYVSLRQDMYNSLSLFYKDGEKIRSDIEFLRWDEEDLKSLIALRMIKENLTKRKKHNISYEDALNLFFDEGIFEYIVKNTLQRPRELIELCNLVAQRYTLIAQRNAEIHNIMYLFNKKIDKEIVDEVMKDFSFNRLNDISKEYNDEFPKIKQVFLAYECCEKKMEINEFIEVSESALIKISDENPDIEWVKNCMERPIKLIEILFSIGFIKISKGNEYYATYERREKHFDNVKSVKINNMFREALQCM